MVGSIRRSMSDSWPTGSEGALAASLLPEVHRETSRHLSVATRNCPLAANVSFAAMTAHRGGLRVRLPHRSLCIRRSGAVRMG